MDNTNKDLLSSFLVISPNFRKFNCLMNLGTVTRLNKDLTNKIKTLTKDEVRYIVDYYYMIQETIDKDFTCNTSEPAFPILTKYSSEPMIWILT